jgi:hypothetical protein
MFSGTIHDSKLPFPLDVFRNIFSHLTYVFSLFFLSFFVSSPSLDLTARVHEIRGLQVSRSWVRACRDNVTWQRLCLEHFGLPGQSFPGTCYDYCGLYQQRLEESAGVLGAVLVLGDVATYLKGIHLFFLFLTFCLIPAIAYAQAACVTSGWQRV